MPIEYDITTDSLYLQGIEKGLEQGVQKGLKQGVERGLAKGVEETKKEAILGFLRLRTVSDEDIAIALNVPLEMVQEIKKQL